ncbi:MAG TPA: hypothetical protein PKY05_17680, partial [Fibrobacteria bacterium]|nr:hypothetical protein [Fibrobacteria bacterium]
MSHENALRDLQAIDLCSQVIGSLKIAPGAPCPCPFCSIRRVDASYFDALQGELESVHQESSPSKTSAFDLWDSLLGLPSGTGLSDDARRSRILEARSKAGGLSKAYFLQLASDLGFTITIDRGVMPLRAGIAKAGDALVGVSRRTWPDPANSLDLRNGVAYPVSPWPTGAGSLGSESTATHLQRPTFPADFWVWTVTVTSLGSHADASLLRDRFEALKPAYSTIVWKATKMVLDGLVGSLSGKSLRVLDGGVGPIQSTTIPVYDHIGG